MTKIYNNKRCSKCGLKLIKIKHFGGEEYFKKCPKCDDIGENPHFKKISLQSKIKQTKM